MRAAFTAFFIFTILPGLAEAKNVIKTEVSDKDGHYQVAFEVTIDAPTKRVRQLMTDYAHLDRISETVVESRILGAKNNKQRVGLTIRSCVLFFCKTIRKVEDVETLENGDIVTLAIPQLSDFRYAREHWQILDEQPQTRIKYQAELWPSFFIPPLIGPWLVKSKIRSELNTSAAILETLARL